MAPGLARMDSTTIVLSPHLDDAVLSCWHVLGGDAEVTVVNLFTGIPEPGTTGWWDEITGASDSAERMRERVEEDRSALELAGRRAVNLDFLDAQYRRNGTEPATLVALLPHADRGSVVYAPASLGLHPDHRLAMLAGLELEARGAEVRFYADLPHAAERGWPAWVTGDEPDPYFDGDALWRTVLSGTGLDLSARAPEVHRLDDGEWAGKLEAMRSYRTQFAAIEREAPLECLRHEVVWRAR